METTKQNTKKSRGWLKPLVITLISFLSIGTSQAESIGPIVSRSFLGEIDTVVYREEFVRLTPKSVYPEVNHVQIREAIKTALEKSFAGEDWIKIISERDVDETFIEGSNVLEVRFFVTLHKLNTSTGGQAVKVGTVTTELVRHGGQHPAGYQTHHQRHVSIPFFTSDPEDFYIGVTNVAHRLTINIASQLNCYHFQSNEYCNKGKEPFVIGN